jgi:predicted amidohydrolase YtcJ
MTAVPDELVAYPETVLYDGEILTVDESFGVAEAVAVRDGRFLAAGDTDAIRALAGPETEEIDLAGRTAIPGLVDSHIHLRQVGTDLDRVTLFDARSIADVQAAIREVAETTPDGEWVTAGWGWHESALAEDRLPTRWELDEAAPGNPVYVPRGAHVAVLNSAGLDRAGIDADTAAPEGGTIVRDSDPGPGTDSDPGRDEPNGVVLEAAREELVEPVVPDRGYQEYVGDVKRAMAELNSRGVTAALEPGLEREELRAFMAVERDGDATVRVDALVRVYDLDDVRETAATFARDFGTGRLKVGGVKYMLDGGVEGAKLSEPYEVVEGVQEQEDYRGHLLLPPGGEDELREVVREAAALGHQFQTHVVGDAAMELLIDCYEAADEVADVADLGWTFMHVFLPPDDVRERMLDLGVDCTVQNHPTYLGRNMERLWGEERAAGAIPIRTLLDEGFTVGGGTDAPVVPWFPFESIWWMVTRETVTAGSLGPEEAITREEALRLWTRGGAATMGWGDEIGSVEPGKRADLAVLDTDFLACRADDLREIGVDLTIVGGEIVHEA